MPACSCSAPQHDGSWGASTFQPSAASTAAVSAFTPLNITRWTQPRSTATVPRDSPWAATCSGSAWRTGAAGASLATSAIRPSGSEAVSRSSFVAAPKRISGTSQRIRSGWGKSANTALRVHLSWPLRSHLRSTWARVSSISLSYCTPDGQAVTHAMQPRQLSK